MTKFNPLIVILSPRDIGLVREQIQKIIHTQFDTIWVKYFPAPASYNIGIQTFLKDFPHHNYFCLIPDDLVINQKSWDILIQKAKTGKYDVISGVCNQRCDTDAGINQTNICFTHIPDPALMSLQEVNKSWVTFDNLQHDDTPKEVAFAGFPVTFIKKWVIKKMGEFTGDSLGQNIDVSFAHFLVKNDIKHFVVPSAHFLHIKHHPDPELSSTKFFVGKKYPEILHYKPSSVKEKPVIPLLRK